MMGQQLGAGDDARRAEGRAPHRLRGVELRVLERRSPYEPIDQPGRKTFARNVDLVAEHRADALGHRTGDGRQGPSPRRRRGPGLLVVFVGERQAKVHDAASLASLLHNRPGLRFSEASKPGEERPLVGPRIELLVEEYAVAALPRAALQGKRDEVAESAFRYRVLAREESVVGVEAEIGVALHGLGQDMGAEAARE